MLSTHASTGTSPLLTSSTNTDSPTTSKHQIDQQEYAPCVQTNTDMGYTTDERTEGSHGRRPILILCPPNLSNVKAQACACHLQVCSHSLWVHVDRTRRIVSEKSIRISNCTNDAVMRREEKKDVKTYFSVKVRRRCRSFVGSQVLSR
jgi:hypothetical protein